MAKENFDRSKPHVNIGAVSEVLQDTTGGQLTFDGRESVGNPSPGTQLVLWAPNSSALETATIAYPIDTDFVFNPPRGGAATSIDFDVDVLPLVVDGTSELRVTLAIVQDKPFLAEAEGGSTGAGSSWQLIGDTGLRAGDFSAVDGSAGHPDFSRPFQFGYAFTGQYSTEELYVQVGVDNMHVQITTIPEPSSVLLLLAMGAAVVLGRWLFGRGRPRL